MRIIGVCMENTCRGDIADSADSVDTTKIFRPPTTVCDPACGPPTPPLHITRRSNHNRPFVHLLRRTSLEDIRVRLRKNRKSKLTLHVSWVLVLYPER